MRRYESFLTQPNFMSIVPRWQLLRTKTPLKELSHVIQLFHACSANFILLITIEGSNLQRRRKMNPPKDMKKASMYLFVTSPAWRRRIKHFLSLVPNWRRRCPRPKASAPRPSLLCFAALFTRRLIKHDLCRPLPLARIYCTASIKKAQNIQICILLFS